MRKGGGGGRIAYMNNKLLSIGLGSLWACNLPHVKHIHVPQYIFIFSPTQLCNAQPQVIL